MAVRLETWIGSRGQGNAIAEASAPNRVLSVEERRARLHRRHRLTRVQGALGGLVWLAGSGAVLLVAFVGAFGLRY
jgi:hypothetical protein